MRTEEKQYIISHAGQDSVKQIAKHLHVRERAVKRFLERRQTRAEPQTPREPNSRRWQKCFPFLLILLGLCAYQNSFTGPFILDDEHAIVNDAAIRRPLEVLKSIRPLGGLSFAINYAFSGLNVWGYHAVNVTIHLLAALCFFGLVRRTFLTTTLRDRYGQLSATLAFAIAALWQVHPLETQSVTYIIQRYESMMSLFYLFTLYAVNRGVTSRRWRLIAVASCAAGMATKEMMVTAPMLAIIYDRIFLASSWREIVKKRSGLYIGLAASWLILLIVFLRQDLSLVAKYAGIGQNVTWFEYARTQPGVVLHYLRLSVWPHPLCFDYVWPVAKTMQEILPPSLVIGALLIATLFVLRKDPPTGFLGIWFFLILAPTSSVMPILDRAAEHRMYLPLAAVVVIAVLGGRGLLGFVRERMGLKGRSISLLSICLLLGLVSVLATLTFRRNQVYASQVSMWRDTVLKRPNNARAHSYLGVALQKTGDLGGALDHLREATRISPTYLEAQVNLGTLLTELGELDEAERRFAEALRIDPDFSQAHYNLGNVLDKQGKFDDAIEGYQKTISLKPDFAQAHNNLGTVLFKQRKLEEAKGRFLEALRLDPSHSQAYNNLGLLLVEQGKVAEAISYYMQALNVKPDYAIAHNNLGLALMEQEKFADAITHFSDALRINPDYENARNNLRNAQTLQKAREASQTK